MTDKTTERLPQIAVLIEVLDGEVTVTAGQEAPGKPSAGDTLDAITSALIETAQQSGFTLEQCHEALDTGWNA